MSMQEVQYSAFSKSSKSRETEISGEQLLGVDVSTEMSVVEAIRENVSTPAELVTKVDALLRKATEEKTDGQITRTEETIEMKAEADESMKPPDVAAALAAAVAAGTTTTEVVMSGKGCNEKPHGQATLHVREM